MPVPSVKMDLRSRVLEAVRREPSATRPVETCRGALLLAIGFVVALVAATPALELMTRDAPEIHDGRPAWHVLTSGGAATSQLAYVVTLEVAWLLVAVAATWGGLARGRSMLGRPAVAKIAVATLTPLALVLTWLVVGRVWLETFLPLGWLDTMDDAQSARFHLNCALQSVACGVGPLVAFFALRRRREPVRPAQTGAALGAVAGTWAAVLRFPFCQCSSPLHIALGHVLPVAVLALLGALLGPRVIGLRASVA